MYKSIEIANYFIKKSLDEGSGLTPMKLIKLSYIAHGWHLGIHNEPLIGEAVYAWRYGPVIKEIYDAFKRYGNSVINELYYNEKDDEYPLPDNKIKEFLDFIWSNYKDYSGLQLSTLTHKADTPWDIVWNKNNGKKYLNEQIPNNLILAHYKEKFKESNSL